MIGVRIYRKMVALWTTLLAVLWLIFSMLQAIDWQKLYISPYSLKSTKNKKSSTYLLASNLPAIYKLAQYFQMLTLALVVFVISRLCSIPNGLVIIIFGILLSSYLAHLRYIKQFANHLLKLSSAQWIWLARRLKIVLDRLPGLPLSSSSQIFGDQDELIDTVLRANILSTDEKSAISHILKYRTKTVRSAMKPISDLRIIRQNTIITPKLLDEMHHAGQTYCLVVDKSINHPIGFVYIKDIQDIKLLETNPRAGDVVRAGLNFIHKDASLADLVNLFALGRVAQVLVVDDDPKIIGEVSLKTLIVELIGFKPDAEFDVDRHDSPLSAIEGMSRPKPYDANN